VVVVVVMQPFSLEQLNLVWNSDQKKCCRWPRGGPRRGDARHQTSRIATRLPPGGPSEAHAKILSRRRIH
jgi:hypothetical protein